MKNFKEYFTEASLPKYQFKSEKDERDFWEAIGSVLEVSMSQQAEDRITKLLQSTKKGEPFPVTKDVQKAIDLALKDAPDDAIDKNQVRILKMVKKAAK